MTSNESERSRRPLSHGQLLPSKRIKAAFRPSSAMIDSKLGVVPPAAAAGGLECKSTLTTALVLTTALLNPTCLLQALLLLRSPLLLLPPPALLQPLDVQAAQLLEDESAGTTGRGVVVVGFMKADNSIVPSFPPPPPPPPPLTRFILLLSGCNSVLLLLLLMLLLRRAWPGGLPTTRPGLLPRGLLLLLLLLLPNVDIDMPRERPPFAVAAAAAAAAAVVRSSSSNISRKLFLLLLGGEEDEEDGVDGRGRRCSDTGDGPREGMGVLGATLPVLHGEDGVGGGGKGTPRCHISFSRISFVACSTAA
jgi:hypothetical protein